MNPNNQVATTATDSRRRRTHNEESYTHANNVDVNEKPLKFTSSRPSGMPPLIKVILGWLVHLYTASGAIVNFYNIYYSFIVGKNFHLFCRLNWLAIFIDATDGTMARAIDIKNTVPSYDGALLDNIIDFITFSVLPSLSVIRFEIVPFPYYHLLATCILIGSCYAFCQTRAKTDSAFVGFPSYWNIVVFYMYYLELSTLASVFIVVTCTILSFIPIHFIYPTKTKDFQAVTLTGAYIWGALMLFVSFFPEHPYVQPVLYVSSIYVFYYIGMSLYLDWKRRRQISPQNSDSALSETQSLHAN